jgi:hypothetical protein
MSFDPTTQSSGATAAEWSSSISGWHARATTHPDGADYTPKADALVFAVIHSLPADPEGFSLALFKPDAAVDARGAALKLQQDDWDALARLSASAISDVPAVGSFPNQWRIAQPTTSQPIDRLLAKNGDKFDQVSISGYSKTRTALKSPVGDITELPGVLYEFFGLLQEGREGYERGTEDIALIGKVKALLQDVI